MEPGDFQKRRDLLKNRLIIRTRNQEISRPTRSRTPSLKDLEVLRPTMALMDLMELHKLQQRLEGLCQIENELTMEKRNEEIKPFSETVDSYH